MLHGMAVRAVTYDEVGRIEICAWDFWGGSFGNAAPMAWFGQACITQLYLDPETVLSIMRYP
jgi:hypothetical protein